MTRAEVDARRGEIAAARASLDELVSRLRDVFGNDSPEHLRARSGRAALLLHTGEDEQALEEHRTVLAALNRSRGASDAKTLEQAGKVDVALVNLSRYGEAEQILRGTLEQMRDAGVAGRRRAVRGRSAASPGIHW